jgi:hypothetical protein
VTCVLGDDGFIGFNLVGIDRRDGIMVATARSIARATGRNSLGKQETGIALAFDGGGDGREQRNGTSLGGESRMGRRGGGGRTR